MVSVARSTSRSRTVLAGAIGNVLEWYDFALFGFLTPIIAPLFFPSSVPLASLLETYGVFALGFFMRPLGGVLFGHIGDRLGRRVALLWSVLLMAIPTTMIAFLPTYAQIGLAAPLLLTLIRIVQGISVGGEFIGSMSFLGEHAQASRRGWIASWCGFSAGLGNLLGSAVAALVTTLVPAEELAQWGWRIPFLGGLAVGVVGLWLRSGLAESPAFEQARSHGQTLDAPALVALRRDYVPMILTIGIALMLGIGFYLPWVWLSTWLARINTPAMKLSEALVINTLAMSLMVSLLPVAGWLSDVWGRKRVMVTGSLVLAVLSYPLFLLLSQGTVLAALSVQLLLAVCTAMIQGPASAAFVELFPTQTRYSGIAIAYNVSLAVFGGTTPFVATFLIEMTGYKIAPAFYLMAAALGCGLASWWMIDRTGKPL